MPPLRLSKDLPQLRNVLEPPREALTEEEARLLEEEKTLLQEEFKRWITDPNYHFEALTVKGSSAGRTRRSDAKRSSEIQDHVHGALQEPVSPRFNANRHQPYTDAATKETLAQAVNMNVEEVDAWLKNARASDDNPAAPLPPAQQGNHLNDTTYDAVLKWVGHTSIEHTESIGRALDISKDDRSVRPRLGDDHEALLSQECEGCGRSDDQVLYCEDCEKRLCDDNCWDQWRPHTRKDLRRSEFEHKKKPCATTHNTEAPHTSKEAPWTRDFTRQDSDSDSDCASQISNTDSVFSVESLASTATGLSAASGYSAAQIETATRALTRIFLENEHLVPLYKTAIGRTDIGRERLQRNLRRLLKAFARNLHVEAEKELENLAARLVSLKTSYVAQSIVNKFDPTDISVEIRPDVQPVPAYPIKDDSSDEEEIAEVELLKEPVDEHLIKDLSAFRQFLAGGGAFIAFQQQLQAFVIPNPSKVKDNAATMDPLPDEDALAKRKDDLPMNNGEEQPEIRLDQSLLSRGQELLANLFIVAGYLEPPLRPGCVRLRWRCKCGDSFWGDVTEYREGGVDKLVERMNRSTGAVVTITTYSDSSTNQKWNFKSPSWVRNTARGFSFGLTRPSKSTGTLPRHNNPVQMPNLTSPSTSSTPSSRSILHLMACVHQTQRRKRLVQDRVDQVKNDRALFLFMKDQIKRSRRRIRTLLSLRSIHGIYFVKFRLRIGNMVEVREHNPCCTSSQPSLCDCIPPKEKVEPSPDAEYLCDPHGPLATWPPVCPQDLMHMLDSPDCLSEQGTSILDQLPRRTCGQLAERTDQPAEGWGIYYQEGVDFDIIIGVVFGIFLLASLLFGILWTKLEMDIQGAFGVSSYMVAASGISMAWLASRAKNFS